MERKLELKDIAWYLPYGLKVIRNNVEYDIVCADCQVPQLEVIIGGGVVKHTFLQKIKPLLNPMSSLTKPMTVKGYSDGEPFTPIDVLKEMHYDFEIEGAEAKIFRLDELQFLSMCHFDFQDLIGQGLAIDKTKYNQ